MPSGHRSIVTARPFIHGRICPAMRAVELREIELGQTIIRPERFRRIGDDGSAEPDPGGLHSSCGRHRANPCAAAFAWRASRP